MNRTVDGVRLMCGGEPHRAEAKDFTPGAVKIHEAKKHKKEDFKAIFAEQAEYEKKKRWKKRRWAVLIAVNLFFMVSYWLDVQALEGSLTGSRFVGFHLVDINSALQVMLAHKHVILNLLIGTATVGIGWLLLGGRTFCAWVCPYHLLSELGEMLHLKLAAKKWVKDHPLHRGLRVALWVAFALLAYGTGYTVYETISPTGIVSRALIYGPGLALLWVGALLAFEILYSRRAWCRYMCPIGLTYGFVGAVSPVKITYNLAVCHHELECRKVCLVPHVLDHVIKGRASEEHIDIGADCTRCGMCVDVCPTQALSFKISGLTRPPKGTP